MADSDTGVAHWADELEQELERRASTYGECEHGRSAYRDAARLVEEFSTKADFDAFEEKMDELNDGLLEAYAAGFSQAVETFDFEPDFDTDVRSLKQNEAVAESHYYFWDGRTKPLEFWLEDQFGIGPEVGEDE